MANKDRNKRSARKARAAEREAQASAQQTSSATTATASKSVAKAEPSKVAKKAASNSKPGFFGRIKTYINDVRSEMHRVVWPSKDELKGYTVAVTAMLVIFGVAVWLIDTGVVAGLVGFTGLRG